MPRPKSEPLTLAQQALIYAAYSCPSLLPDQPLDQPAVTMASLAKQYKVSISVIHRAIHNEAFRRGEAI